MEASRMLRKIKEMLKNAVGEARIAFDELSYNEVKSKQFIGALSHLLEYITKLLAFLFITVFAFYPETVMNLFWTFLIVLTVGVAVTIMLVVFFPEAYLVATMKGFNYLSELPISVVFKSIGSIFLIILITILLPSPNYYKVIGLIMGSLPVLLLFAFSIIISFALATLKFPKILILGAVYVGFLYFLVPLIIFVATTKACIENVSLFGIEIPLISDFLEGRSCKRLISSSLMMTGKKYPVISTSGISVKIGLNEMLPLPAGHSYKEVVFISNNYQASISLLDIRPYIKSGYRDVIFVPVDYVQKKHKLLRDETYGEELTFNPSSLKVDSMKKCLWTSSMISQAGYVSECAYDIPCESMDGFESTCVETGKLQCECVDWIKATCSGEPLNIILSITHTGFLVGKGTLYYFEDYTPQTLPYYKYSQYPAEAVFNFIPNPWFQKRYSGYIDEVRMFAQIRVYGSNPQITYLEVEPITTVVEIENEYEGLLIRETIGIKKEKCTSLEEINRALRSTGSWSGILCTFTPPSVTVEIKDLKNDKEILSSSISVGLINQYCNAEYINISSYPNINLTIMEKYWKYLREVNMLPEDVKRIISDYGICSYLRKAKTEEEAKKKKIIEENLRRVEVNVRFDYIVTETFTSRKIYPYYTSLCEKEKA